MASKLRFRGRITSGRIPFSACFLFLLCCRLPVFPDDTLATSQQAVLPTRSRAPYPGAPLLISAPLLDFPYGRRGGLASPSMRQSLQWNAGAVQAANQTIGWLWEGAAPTPASHLGTWISLGIFNYLSVYLPPGQAWRLDSGKLSAG